MIAVSDRALLRFMEREGFDVELTRDALRLSLERAHAAAAELGIRNYLLRTTDHIYVVRDDVVTTVLPPAAPRARFFALAPRTSAA